MRRPSKLVPPRIPICLSSRQAEAYATADDSHRLHRLRRNSYVALPKNAQPHAIARARHLAAAQLVHDGMALTHTFVRESAAILHGLRVWRTPRCVEVGVPPGSSGNPSGLARRHRTVIPESHLDAAAGLPVTTIDRTVLDIARFSHPGEALIPLDHFLSVATRAYLGERERTDTRATELKNHLLEMLGRLPPGSPGIRRARAVIEHASPWAESPWETRLRWILLLAGFTSVELQVEVRIGGQRYRSDLAIPIGRRPDGRTIWLHIEFDGRIKYGRGSADATSETMRRERERELSITGTRDRLVRFTADELTDHASVVAKIREQLADIALPPLRPVRSLAA
ncbi:MAG: hypothetical protein ACTH0C_08645 [Actinomycetaceae bacterium]